MFGGDAGDNTMERGNTCMSVFVSAVVCVDCVDTTVM